MGTGWAQGGHKSQERASDRNPCIHEGSRGWRANHRKDVAGYQLRFQHRGSILPILNITIPGAESSTYSVQQCHSFVADFNLTNWDWSVRAIDDQGQPGESTQGTFDFAPCRLDDGTPCHP